MATGAPLFNLEQFWRENELSDRKPFRTDKPRAPITVAVDDHWLLQEMQVPSTVRYFADPGYRVEVNRACNDRCEESLGRRFFSEAVDPPAVLRIEEVMGSHRELVEGGTPWLEPGVSSIDEMRSRLSEIEGWSDAYLRQVIFATGGQVARSEGRPVVTPGSRGPATQATSILGTMNSMYWLIDYPADMERFFDVLGDIIIRYHRIMESETGVVFRGYSWLDDNCALYSPELYERFCYPVVKRVMDAFAPDPADHRFHHSDSEMRHLLPLLSALGFHGVNLGPAIPAFLIRRHVPHAVIHGCVAPNTLRDRGLDAVVAEVRRDFAAVGADGGLVVTTCGSISAGTSLESIRGFMWAVQEYCRYD
ncbi:MAG: uroporphyrinogen decarboxylase family protein [Fimbriimonadales bacterium]